MKKIYLFFVLTLFFISCIHFNSYSQNCDAECSELIENPTLELTYEGTDPIFVHGAFYPTNMWVEPWTASVGSPHLAYLNQFGICWAGSWNPASGEPLFNCVSTSYRIQEQEGYMEGLLQNVAFNGDGYSEYCITVNANYLDCFANQPPPMHFVIRAANNLVWDLDYSTDMLPFVIPGSDVFEIDRFEIDSYNPMDFTSTFTPQNDYDQFEIVAILEPSDIDLNGDYYQEGNMTINNVSITCETTSLTDLLTVKNELDVQFSAQNASSSDFTEYSWSFGDGNTSSSPSPSHTYEEYGSYKVCLDITNEHGCCGSLCDTITIFPPPISCMYNDETIFFNGNSQSLNKFSDYINNGLFANNGTLNDETIIVSGAYTLDSDFSFIGCHFFFEPGAELIVKSPGLIRIGNSDLQGCTQMWKGISVEGTGSTNQFWFLNNEISDAYSALSILDGASVRQASNIFDTNYIGIFSPSSQNVKTHFGSDVRNCTFISKKTMLPAYAGQPLWSDITYAGIFVSSLDHLIVSQYSNPHDGSIQKNIFDGIRNGIIATRSSLTIHGNEFKNLVGAGNDWYPTPISPDISGRGLLIHRTPVLNVKSNEFNNLFRGITVNNTMGRINITSNVMYNDPGYGQLDNGIHLYRCDNSDVYIGSNNISGIFETGIGISRSHNLNSLLVHYNNLNNDQTRLFGIIANNLTFVNSGFIENNNITRIGEINAGTSIAIQSSENISVNNNILSLTKSSPGDLSEINLNNSPNCHIRDNYITFSGSPGVGIRVRASLGNLYCCNTVNNGYYASYFSGQCNPTNLSTTEMQDNFAGVYLLDAQIGPQFNKSNFFAGPTTRARIRSFVEEEQEIANASIFTVDFGESGMKPDFIIPVEVENIWFQPDPTIDGVTCIQNPDCGVTPFEFVLPPTPPNISDPCENFREYVEALVGPRISGYFKDQNDWTLYYYVFHHFDGIPPEFWEDCTTIKTFMDNTTIVPDYHGVDKSYKNAYAMDEANINSKTNSLISLEQSFEQLESLFSTISTDSEYLQNGNQIISLQQSIQSLTGVSIPIFENAELSGLTTLGNLIPQIQTLPEVHSFHSKLKDVWEIKVKVAINGIESILSSEWDNMRIIANNCHLEDGQAVFEAQELLTAYGENSFTSSDISCIRNVPREKLELSKGFEEIEVFPNPSNGKWTIDFIDTNPKILNIQISDNLGKIVYSEMVEEKVDRKEVSVKNITNGIYLMNIFHKNRVIYTQKLIVIDN